MVHVPSFFKELEDLKQKGLDIEGRIFISDRAHIIFDLHQLVDGLEEQELGKRAVGTLVMFSDPSFPYSSYLGSRRPFQPTETCLPTLEPS